MIAQIGSTHLRLRFSFVAAVTLMLYFCDEKVVLSAFFASLFHESGHIIIMLLCKAKLKAIDLGLFGIRIDRANSALLSYKKEALIALGGIIFNLCACLFFYILKIFCGNDTFLLFSAVNLLVAMINSIPNGYLDLGRALHFFMLCFMSEHKAERITEGISVICSVILLVFWLFYSLFVRFNLSLTAVTLYLAAITFKKKGR